MAVRSRKIITFDSYLELEEHTNRKHEFVGGFMYRVAGAGERHNLIATNFVLALGAAMREKGCRLYVADMKLRTPADAAYYPDVMVVCDASDQHNLYRTSPCPIVEILSRSTSTTDRREKLLECRRIESLENYLIVDPEKPRIGQHFGLATRRRVVCRSRASRSGSSVRVWNCGSMRCTRACRRG